jgi:hypothetical protein
MVFPWFSGFPMVFPLKMVNLRTTCAMGVSPPQESLAELPELPSVDRLQQLLQQTRGELAQLVALAERAKAQAGDGRFSPGIWRFGRIF